MTLDLNGERMQTGNTSTMIFGVAEIVVSSLMTLRPGDVINTGTPPGVGSVKNLNRYLREGDVMELWIEKLERKNNCCAGRG